MSDLSETTLLVFPRGGSYFIVDVKKQPDDEDIFADSSLKPKQHKQTIKTQVQDYSSLPRQVTSVLADSFCFS